MVRADGRWIKKVVWRGKEFILVDKYLHYLYIMSLLGSKREYRRLVKRASRLRAYYSARGLRIPRGFMFSVVHDFDSGGVGKIKKRALGEAVKFLKNRNTLKLLRALERRRVKLYRYLHSVALSIHKRVLTVSRLRRIASVLLPFLHSPSLWRVRVVSVPGFSPPRYTILVEKLKGKG